MTSHAATMSTPRLAPQPTQLPTEPCEPRRQPGSVDGLRDGVEAAMRSVLGLDAVPVTPQMRASYANVAKAIAWAGLR